MAFNIGLNVIETDGSASAAIQGAATSIAAFNIRTVRGIPHRPTRVTSFADYVARFGGFDATTPGAYMVKGFFDNGGSVAYINRVTGSAADTRPAVATLVTRSGTGNTARDILRFSGGYRGQSDPGSWANGLAVAIIPSFSSAPRQGAVIASDGSTLVSLAGFNVGDSVIVTNGTRSSTVTVTSLNAATGAIGWSNLDTPADFDPATTVVESSDFDTVLSVGGSVVESWPRLNMARDADNYAVARLNDSVRGSKLVLATDERLPNSGGAEHPGRADPMVLSGGSNGTVTAADYLGSEGPTKTGFRAFDPYDVQLITADLGSAGVIAGGLGYCESRGDCMFVGAVPEGSVAAGSAIDFGAQFQGKKVYGALYGPWIQVIDQRPGATTPTRWIPPTGHVLGVYARTETTRGIHKAPAGDDARLVGALDVEHRLSETDHTQLVKLGSVNGIRVVPGAGIVVDASRTLSTDTRWLYVNVRLLFNYVKSSLRSGLRWVRQEPNKDTLWNAVTYGTVRPFLMGLYRQGAFGTGEPDDVFSIVCDETNNPPDEIDKGNFKVEIYFYPSKPAETIVIVVGQQAAGGSAAES